MSLRQRFHYDSLYYVISCTLRYTTKEVLYKWKHGSSWNVHQLGTNSEVISTETIQELCCNLTLKTLDTLESQDQITWLYSNIETKTSKLVLMPRQHASWSMVSQQVDNQVLKLGDDCPRSGHENNGNKTRLDKNNCNSLLNNSEFVTELEPYEIMVT